MSLCMCVGIDDVRWRDFSIKKSICLYEKSIFCSMQTHKELTETVDELLVENAQLLKEVEQSKKTCQGLKHHNVNLKSQLALCLEQRQERNMPDISQPLSSSYSDTRHKTITMASCDNLQSYEHENFSSNSDS